MNITQAESQIMEALWTKSPLTPDDVIRQMAEKQGWAEGTVRTLITRLLRKKAISAGRENGGYFYRPLVSRGAYIQIESQGLLDRLFDGQVAPFVAHFAEHRTLSPKDIEILERLITELKNDSK